jgi:hypothetical protein
MVLVNDKLEKTSYTVTIKDVDYQVVIQQPEFKQLQAAMAQMITSSGGLDMVGSGKVIFELCCIECPDEVKNNAKVLVSLCMELYADFVSGADAIIKKN